MGICYRDECEYEQDALKARIAELEAALRHLKDFGLEFEDTGTASIALTAWRVALAKLET